MRVKTSSFIFFKTTKRFLFFFILFLFFFFLSFACAGKQRKPFLKEELKEAKEKKEEELKKGYFPMPNLLGKTLNEAQIICKDLNLKLKWEENLGRESHLIVWQMPSSGELVKEGWVVWIIGEESEIKVRASVTIPDSDTSNEKMVFEKVRKEKIREKKSSYVVCLDPGHQRKANLELEPIGPGSPVMKEKCRGGTKGVLTKKPESQVNLEIALKLKEVLEREKVKVVMTRTSDNVNLSNVQRAAIANKHRVQIFVRIHADGSLNSSQRGASTLYPARNKWTELFYQASFKAAKLVQSELVKSTGLKDNGLVARSDLSGFNWSRVPVILVEVGFLTNPEEDRLLNQPDFQRKIAQGIAQGILKFLSLGD